MTRTVALALFLLVPAATASGAADVHYTSSADFDRGRLHDVNHDQPDQLQLAPGRATLPFITVAASQRGTIARIDIETGRVVGEYISSPEDRGQDPSSIAIDRRGNAWYANRNEHDNGLGSAGRIGVVVGGTRVNADGTPNPEGDYLAGPFDYNTCVDRDGDGLIATSRGLGDLRAWTNKNGADNMGGVTTARDECTIAYQRVAGEYTEFVAIDSGDDAWTAGKLPTGTWNEQFFEEISGETGLAQGPDTTPGATPGCGGGPGVIDHDDVVWAGSYNVGFVRLELGTKQWACQAFPPAGPYGFAVDPLTGDVWRAYEDEVERLAPDGTVAWHGAHGGISGRGVAVDRSGNVWVAHPLEGTVGRLHKSGTFVGHVTLPVSGGNGVSVDANGKVWVTAQAANAAYRIDPARGVAGEVDLEVPLGDGAGPDNNSDMTGSTLPDTAARTGTWTATQDAGVAGARWAIAWNTEPAARVPRGASIRVEARAADAQAALAGAEWHSADDAPRGRFVEVRATLVRAPDGQSPVLSDLRVTATTASAPAAPAARAGSVAAAGSARGAARPATRRACASRRAFRIRIRDRRHRLASVSVFVGKRRATVRRGRRITAPVVLRGLPRGRYTVTIVARTTTGKVLRSKRRYRTCTTKRRAAKPTAIRL